MDIITNVAIKPKDIDDDELKKKLQPTLRLIITILDQYLKKEWENRRYKHVPRIFIQGNNLLDIIETYLLLVKNEELCFYISNIAHLIHVIVLCADSKNIMISEHEAIPNLERMFYLIETAVNKKHCTNVMKLTYLTVNNWFLVHKRLLPTAHKDINKDPLIFQNQIVVMQIVPIFQFLEMQFKLNCDFDEIDDLRELYVCKVVRQLCQYTIRLGYSYRNLLLNWNQCAYNLAFKAMQHIQLSVNCYQRETAVIVFQSLVYAFNDCNSCLKCDPKQTETALLETKFYFLLIKVLKDLIEKFDFNWTDCIESICVVNTILDFLLLANWSTKVRNTYTLCTHM